MAIPVAKIAFRLPTPDGLGSSAGHVRYIATHKPVRDEDRRPLFGPDPTNPPRTAATQREVLAHTGPTCRFVLSLREDDAIRWGYVSRQDWEAVVRDAMPRIAREMGLDVARIRWVAAYHQDPGHYHCHVLLWESPPIRQIGKLRKSEIAGVRKAWARTVLAPVRAPLEARKTALRDAIRAAGAKSISEALAVARGLRGRDPLARELALKIDALARRMPGHGRAALAYMPPDVKHEARRIAGWLLGQPPYAAQVADYRRGAEEIARLYALKDPVRTAAMVTQAGDRAVADLRDRVAQAVVRASAMRNAALTRGAAGGRGVTMRAAARAVLAAARAALAGGGRGSEEKVPPELRRRKREREDL